MTLLLMLAVAVLVGAAVLAVGQSIRVGRRSTTAALSTVGQYGYETPVTPIAQRRAERSMALEKVMANLARRLSKDGYEQQLRQRLIQAGMYTTEPSRFLMYQSGGMILLGLLGLSRAASAPNRFAALCMIVGAPVLGWMVPNVLLGGRIKRRHERIERDAADMIDLLAITVHAGLGLDQALKVTSDRLEGPLSEEMRLMLNEIRVGQSRGDALRRLSERVDTPTIRAFARSMAQSESLGVSISETLRALAVDARMRKRMMAEERAQKAPIKMVFPLAVCIFPAILIIAAGPGILVTVRTLLGGG